jgi:putative cell wall-binding protein
MDASWKRLDGANRYHTASLIVSEAFETSQCAVIATGVSYPDALCAASLAGARDCPLLLTDPNALSAETEAQVKRLGVKQAYVVGGAVAVGPSVESRLKDLGVAVTRINGSDRYATGVEVLKAVRQARATSDTVIVATGQNFPDALSIGPWAYATSSPVVLANGQGLLNEDEVRAIREASSIRRILLVGGSAVVSDDVAKQLGPSYAVERLGGTDRYDTSARVAVWEVGSGTLGWGAPVLATGKDFPDALAAASLGGRKRSVVLVANSSADASLRELRAHKDAVTGGYLCGGVGVMPISDPFGSTLRASLESPTSERRVVTFGGYEIRQSVADALMDATESLRAEGYDLGYIMMDLGSLKGVAYNCDALFYGASSIKAPYFSSVINLHPEALWAYQYDIQETLFYSWDYNYKQVLEAFGSEPMRVWCEESGARASIAESLPWAIYSARDLALMWARMYQLYSQSPEGETLGSWCERPNVSCIHATLSDRFRTRSKAGWVSYGGPIYEGVNDGKPLWDVADDGGIVYANNGTYVMAIMSNIPAGPNLLNVLTETLNIAHSEM